MIEKSNKEFSSEELQRYSRHLVLPEVGMEGQKKLASSRVLIIGAGGLGSPAALYLAAAGVGRIGLVDFDAVDISNLQRQVLYSTNDVGTSKLSKAKERILALNPHITVDVHQVQLSSTNALDIFREYDIVVDGTDNFPTRYLTNDACALLGKPNVYGSIFRFEGQVSVFDAKRGPCYRCLYPAPPPPGLVPSCAEGGVLGVLPGIIGSMQALEAIKLIIGGGESLIGRLVLFDALTFSVRELKLKKNPACPLCGEHPSIHGLIDYDAFCGGGPPVPKTEKNELDITPGELKSLIDRGDKVILIDVREPFEYEICNLGGILMPMNSLKSRMHELDKSKEIVVYCKTGRRSAKASEVLRASGFQHVKNLVGGIMRWIDEVDPSLKKY